MKKRLLALALCLVMMTSLLPLTAAADTYYLTSVTIKASGVEEVSGEYKLKNIQYELIDENIGKISDPVLNSDKTGWMYTEYYSHAGDVGPTLKTPPEKGEPYYVKIDFGHSYNEFNGNSSFSATLEIPGYTVERLGNPKFASNRMYLLFKITKNHEHTWQLTQTDSTLTVECGNNGCPIRKMSVELKANSVTLPNSPFNAWLEGWEQLVSEFPEAKYKFDYKYKGPGDSEYRPVDPIAANAKAGEYQVGVSLWDITRGPIDPSEGTYLFVKYTAVDPAITAQTGDSRPIELMMAGVLVFSALAAAAFIVDSKRRSHQ